SNGLVMERGPVVWRLVWAAKAAVRGPTCQAPACRAASSRSHLRLASQRSGTPFADCQKKDKLRLETVAHHLAQRAARCSSPTPYAGQPKRTEFKEETGPWKSTSAPTGRSQSS